MTMLRLGVMLKPLNGCALPSAKTWGEGGGRSNPARSTFSPSKTSGVSYPFTMYSRPA
jgi:hypothetical protein